ncbi:hypothetical protein SDC9_123119 [bioreactor metagenome]|uniref:CO dehydrogenase flavoprotein C-terminal domain-containing protein n=1 Tax=bioreactor metagenome TaxID=1076179 RepID=A0A645CGQ2_9ZZZZ
MRNAMDIATIGCSVNVVLSADQKTIQRARIAYGVAGPVPMRARTAEAALAGQPVGEAAIEIVGKEVQTTSIRVRAGAPRRISAGRSSAKQPGAA